MNRLKMNQYIRYIRTLTSVQQRIEQQILPDVESVFFALFSLKGMLRSLDV
jgi:hypothetical protein